MLLIVVAISIVVLNAVGALLGKVVVEPVFRPQPQRTVADTVDVLPGGSVVFSAPGWRVAAAGRVPGQRGVVIVKLESLPRSKER